MHDAGKSNTYSKYIFAQTGVLYNKAKKPTEATIFSNVISASTADEEKIFKAEDSIKKIFLQEDVAGVSIQSGNNKATLDASAAGASLSASQQVGVSLVGGAKSNRFIGSDYADTFYYTGGKDNITNFQINDGTNKITDAVSFDTDKLNDAKITVSKKSIKFKFDSKNTLTLKGKNTISGALYVNGKEYTFDKNAIVVGNNVSLTSQFSGTYKLSNGVSLVGGDVVSKNLTFKGTSATESLVGGTKKTTFKGNGGDDTLKGGTGKDIFFYAKGDDGNTEIQNFDFGTDKLKIANGTIKEIATVESDSKYSIKFSMTSGKKGDEKEKASFNLTSYSNSGTLFDADTASKVVFKANSTYYWFAQDNVIGEDENGTSTTLAKRGDLITWDKKAVARDVADCAIIDLGYSTNLAKTGVAIKVAYGSTGSDPYKKTS